ncbi:MAG TPA: gliding motility-associated C-terminal domain-containing protein, partial [Chitinophagales bacterium]|nr:gliding motility-associated C-terminal domain-containing protein [Chitinophagales bacterium]
PLATIDDTTLFVVTVTDAFGCDNRDSVLVTMLPLPTVVAAPLSPNSCGGDPVLIIVTGGVSYVWTNDQYITAGMVPGYYTATVPDTTEFIVEGTDANGCVGTDTVILNVLFPFDVTLTSDTCLCFGDCGQLRAQASPGFIYTWSPTAFLDTPTIATPTTCATYDIQYQVIVFDGSCYADTAGVNVCVHPLPAVTAGNDTLIVAGTSAYLVASSDIGMGQYEWTPDSLVDCALCPVTMANPEYITTYVVSFTDDNGCRDADSVVVDVFCSNASIYIPNAFTPDSDNLNDFYMVHGAGFELKFLRIYNRWGEKVFETNDLAQGWDGKYKGVLYEPEVFVYYLEAVCSSGELLSKKGNITLIR